MITGAGKRFDIVPAPVFVFPAFPLGGAALLLSPRRSGGRIIILILTRQPVKGEPLEAGGRKGYL